MASIDRLYCDPDELRDEIIALREALKWAIGKIPEKAESAAGIFCIHCGGRVAKTDYKGLTTDKVTHKGGCIWVRASKLAMGEGIGLPSTRRGTTANGGMWSLGRARRF